jgi:hypothetical protein
MNEELKKKILQDIQKSGFGSEMKALQIIKKAGWRASGSVHYEDLDTGGTRESDIKTHHVCSASSENERVIEYQCFLSLSIEVKKSERPWIVFREDPYYAFELSEGGSALLFVDGTRSGKKGMAHAVGTSGLAYTCGWYGNGMHEAFKSPDQPSRWYSGFVAACKAAEHQLRLNSWQISEGTPTDHHPYLWLSKPVVVLDGQLVSATLDSDENLVLAEEKWCSVKFAYKSENYRREKYFVDVVTLEALQEYLQIQADRNTRLATLLVPKKENDLPTN